jgi:mono/diheme cytochrome c family protein
MKSICISQTLLILLLLAFGFAILAAGQESAKTNREVSARPAENLIGVDLFKEYCEVCHGSDAKGSGSAAEALNKRPAHLTQLARKNGGTFPELHVINYIKGQDVVAVHGVRNMPIWRPGFSQMGSNQDLVQARTYALVKYIEQLQAK